MLELLYEMYGAEDQIFELNISSDLKASCKRAISKQRTDRWTNGPTYKAAYRVACTRLKMDQSTGYRADYQPYNWL